MHRRTDRRGSRNSYLDFLENIEVKHPQFEIPNEDEDPAIVLPIAL